MKDTVFELVEKVDRLMAEKTASIKKKGGFYSLDVHEYLQEERRYGFACNNGGLIFPMSRADWYPFESCLRMEEFYSKGNFAWPKDSFYYYSMDYQMIETPGILTFGYAVCENQLFPCAFFVQYSLEMRYSDDPTDIVPEERVIDPLALSCGKNPECYIGVPMLNSYIDECLLSSAVIKNPLEKFVRDERNRHARELNPSHRNSKRHQEREKSVAAWLCNNLNF